MHFASTLEIDGVGYATAAALLEHGLVQDPGDLYALDSDRLASLPGFGRRSADKLLRSIAGAKERPLWKLLQALGVRHVGPNAARLLFSLSWAYPGICGHSSIRWAARSPHSRLA